MLARDLETWPENEMEERWARWSVLSPNQGGTQWVGESWAVGLGPAVKSVCQGMAGQGDQASVIEPRLQRQHGTDEREV